MSLNSIVQTFENLVKPVEVEYEDIYRHDFVFYRPATNPALRRAAFVLETEPATQHAQIEYIFWSEYKRDWVITTVWATVGELALSSQPEIWNFLGVAQ